MAITESQGYDGTLYEGGFARLGKYVGPPVVSGSGSFKVTETTGDRMLSVAGGEAYAYNVVDSATTTLVGSLPSTAAWYTIVRRIDWTTNTTSVTYVAGGASKAVAAGVNATPGTKYDHVLTLAQVASGDIVDVIDMREIYNPGGPRLFNSIEGRDYVMGGAANGCEALVGTTLYRRVAGAWVLIPQYVVRGGEGYTTVLAGTNNNLSSTFAHNCGGAPDFVQVTAVGHSFGAFHATIVNVTGTTMQVRVRHVDAVEISTTTDIHWYWTAWRAI